MWYHLINETNLAGKQLSLDQPSFLRIASQLEVDDCWLSKFLQAQEDQGGYQGKWKWPLDLQDYDLMKCNSKEKMKWDSKEKVQ